MRLKRLTSTQVTNGLGLSGAEHVTSDPRYIRITDIASDGSLRRDVFASQPRSVVEDKWVVAKDILIASVGATVGKSYFHNQPGEYCFAGYLSRVRINPTVADPKFIYYWTQSRAFWDQVNSQRVSSTIENLSAGRIGQFMTPQPPLANQKEIADYLDHETAEIDAFIKDQTRFYGLLSERDITTMALVRESSSRSAPLRRFGSITLGKMVASARSNEAAPRGAIMQPYLRAASVQPQGLLVLDQNIKEMPFTSTESRTLTLHAGDVVVVEGGAGFGRSAVLNQDLPGWGFQNSINRIRVFPDAADPYFIHYNLQLMLALGELDFTVNQATIPHLTADKLASCPIAYKPLDQQKQVSRAIRNELNRNNAFRADIQASIELARERRAALITAAVTGQIDVTARHKPAAEQLEDDIALGLHRKNSCPTEWHRGLP